MSEKILRGLSGINNLKGTAIFRYVVGIVFIVYGFVLFFLIPKEDIWTKISVPSALWALGLMFVFDGSSILREYFRNKKEISQKGIFQNRERRKINCVGVCLLLILFLFVSIAIFGYFYNNELIGSLIIISCAGGLGGTIYAIRGFYQSLGQGIFDFDKWVWWYVFRPVISAVTGVIVSFFIIGGIINIGAGLNYSRGLMFYSAISFLTGFSFSQFASKLKEIAEAIFSKTKEEKK